MWKFEDTFAGKCKEAGLSPLETTAFLLIIMCIVILTIEMISFLITGKLI